MNSLQKLQLSTPPEVKVFNNPDVVAKGWYVVCRTSEIATSQVKSFTICGQRIAVFRGQDGQIRAIDAYCPHMGTDLGIGKVEGNWVQCFFHNWAFDGEGNCQNIPCQSHIPAKARLQSYATEEKYGLIWIYPEAIAPEPVAEFDELKDKILVVKYDKPLERHCHHHICMMNGIDAQHLRTVHKINVDMELLLQQNSSGTLIDFTLRGEFPSKTWREKLGQKILGSTYEYSMRYANGCMGLLTIMKNVRLVPRLHMIYAYTPIADGRTRIQPIYIAARRPGLFGWIVTQSLLLLTQLSYYFLRGEDGQIYDNIQFKPNALLSIDRPIVEYMNYVNQLKPSIWSRYFSHPE